MRTLRRLAAACLTAALLFGTAGCEEDPLAVLGTDRAFTVYGVLNPRADTQFVRVFPIAGRLEPGDGTPLDARVASTDRETGEVREWTQLVRRDASGDYAHLYWAAFRADYGHTYALEVSGSDDRRSSAEVLVPPQAAVVPGPPRPPAEPVVIPVAIQGQVPRLNKLEAVYWVTYATGFGPTGTPELEHVHVHLSLEGRQRRTSEGWEILLNLSSAYDTIAPQIQARDFYQASYGVRLALITVRGVAANEAWAPPDGNFDPLVLVEPDVMTNVENGFGFVGAGYRFDHAWIPDDEVVARAGFRPL